MEEALEYKDLAAELKLAEGSPPVIEGYAARFHNIDAYNDIIAPNAFAETLPEFMRSGLVLWQHSRLMPIGKPVAAKETDQGLYIRAAVSDTAQGRDAMTLMRDGVVRKLSIGFRTLGREWLETADDVAAHWRSVGYSPTPEDEARAVHGARLLTRVRLYEFSPVSIPANPACDIVAVKSARDRRAEEDGRGEESHRGVGNGRVEGVERGGGARGVLAGAAAFARFQAGRARGSGVLL